MVGDIETQGILLLLHRDNRFSFAEGKQCLFGVCISSEDDPAFPIGAKLMAQALQDEQEGEGTHDGEDKPVINHAVSPLPSLGDTAAKKSSIIGAILWHCKHNTLRKYCY